MTLQKDDTLFDSLNIGLCRPLSTKLHLKVGFDEVVEADVTQLLQSHGEELTNEDLKQLGIQYSYWS